MYFSSKGKKEKFYIYKGNHVYLAPVTVISLGSLKESVFVYILLNNQQQFFKNRLYLH